MSDDKLAMLSYRRVRVWPPDHGNPLRLYALNTSNISEDYLIQGLNQDMHIYQYITANIIKIVPYASIKYSDYLILKS